MGSSAYTGKGRALRGLEGAALHRPARSEPQRTLAFRAGCQTAKGEEPLHPEKPDSAGRMPASRLKGCSELGGTGPRLLKD